MYDWNDLRIFLAVARSGSALAAARELNLNQTTVTRRMDELEHALGAPLFLRGARGSAITPQGQALLCRAEAVESAALTLDGEATRLRRNFSGEIRITAPEVIMSTFIGPLTLRFRVLHPDIRFDYLSAEHRLDLTKGDADIAFRAGDVLEGDTLIQQALPPILWTLYCSANYEGRHGKPVGLAALEGHHILSYSGQMANLALLKTFMSHVRPVDLAGTSNSVANMAGMVRAGVGVSVLPCIVGDMYKDLSRCFPPPVDFGTPWWIVTAPEAHELPSVREFIAFAAQSLRRLRGAISGQLDQDAARNLIETL